MTLRIFFFMLPLIFISACAVMPGNQNEIELSGTTWKLIAFQSMDDSQGTTRIDDPDKYTLSFNSYGRVALRLDCNRGTGSWSNTPTADGNSGSIKFGPIATTRAFCPPPSLGEKLARDLDYVRSYLIKDSKLYLSLMADAGIYEWQPAQ